MEPDKNKYGDWKNDKNSTNTYQTLNNKYEQDKALKDSQEKTNNNRPFEDYIKKREKQIKKQQEKKTDFDVYNYDIEELSAILNFQYIPLNKGIINRRILEFKSKFKNQEKYLIFFSNVEERLLEHLENINAETWTEVYEKETSEAGKVLTERFQSQNEEQEKSKINQIINVEKNIIGQVRRPLEQTYAPKSVVQGKKNPFEIQEINRIVSFDSFFRKFLPQYHSSCNVEEQQDSTRLYTSSNYIMELKQPLTNVISIVLDSVEIPNSWYTFSPDYGTDSFDISWNSSNFTVTIEEGNYSQEQLATQINKQIWEKKDTTTGIHVFRGYYDVSGNYSGNVPPTTVTGLYPFPLLEFKYTKHDNKIKIYNYDPLGQDECGITWFNNEMDKNSCSAKQESEVPRPGGKIDYNLGWLMGFRGTTTIVKRYKYDSSGCRWGSNISSYEEPTYRTTTTYSIPSGSNALITAGIIPTSSSKVEAIYENTIPERSRTPPKGAIINTDEIAARGDWSTGDKIYHGKTVPISKVDVLGSKYFIIVLDDFNNNKPNTDLISMIDTVDVKIKIPSYFNPQTMGIYGKGTFYGNDKPNAQYYEDQGDGFACQDIGETTNERGCSENSLNVDLSSNLTKAQLYSAQQIEFFNKGKGGEALERTKSPNTPDSFARFSVNRKPLDWTDGILYQNTNKQQPERNYFGPVKLVKFGVKLLNDRGFEVNLHDHDWSFSIIVKQLYQY
tara:strand:+ start:129 stop:2312 length:2184 start_codon:yes stop_codon:yes gene_type:complete